MKRISLIMLISFASCYDGNDKLPERFCMGPPRTSGACPDNVQPVCGCNDVTYNNSCEAEAAGVKSWTEGQCQ